VLLGAIKMTFGEGSKAIVPQQTWHNKRGITKFVLRLLLCEIGSMNRRNEQAGTLFDICRVSPHEKQNPDENLMEICYPEK
jgi:hypothetical protein